jgi:hypothetical protein
MYSRKIARRAMNVIAEVVDMYHMAGLTSKLTPILELRAHRNGLCGLNNSVRTSGCYQGMFGSGLAGCSKMVCRWNFD